MEIVPYTTEYLQDFIKKDEYERIQLEKAKQKVAEAMADTGIDINI